MKDEKDKRIVYTASIIGALVALLIVIITARTVFTPIIFNSIVVMLVVLIVIVNVWGILGEAFIMLFKKAVRAKREHFLAKKYFKKFNRFIDRFGELFEPRRSDNIPHVLNILQSEREEFREISPSIYDFNGLFIIFTDGIKKLRRNKKNFLLVIRWFESILNVYDKQLVCKPVERIRNLGRDKISEHIKEEYKKNREAYVRFIQDYVDFVKSMNKDFGRKVALRDYFDLPKEL